MISHHVATLLRGWVGTRRVFACRSTCERTKTLWCGNEYLTNNRLSKDSAEPPAAPAVEPAQPSQPAVAEPVEPAPVEPSAEPPAAPAAQTQDDEALFCQQRCLSLEVARKTTTTLGKESGLMIDRFLREDRRQEQQAERERGEKLDNVMRCISIGWRPWLLQYSPISGFSLFFTGLKQLKQQQ